MFFKDLKLSAMPFRNTTDPAFFHMTDTAREACQRIAQGVEQQAPYVVLSGEPGMGKTTLVHYLMAVDIPSVHWLYINQTTLTWKELQIAIWQLLADPGTTPPPTGLNHWIAARLKQVVEKQQLPVLIIDEAQCLDSVTLDELFNWRTHLNSQDVSITIILSGQTELTQTLLDKRLLTTVSDSVHHGRLTQMTFEECRAMIGYRLKKAGYAGPALFSDTTLRTVYALSGGIPRRVVAICDLAMFTTVAHVGEQVTPKDVRDISEYIIRTAGEMPVTKQVPDTISTGPLSNLELHPNPGNLAPSFFNKMAEVVRMPAFRGVLTDYRKYIAPRWRKYLTSWQSASWPWKKALFNFTKRLFGNRNPQFWPWGWAVAYLLIVIGLGYAWLPSPNFTFSPPTSYASRPIGQVLNNQSVRQDNKLFAADKSPLLSPSFTDLSQITLEQAAISNTIPEEEKETIEIAEIFAAPEISIDEVSINKDTILKSVETVATKESETDPADNFNRFQARTQSILKDTHDPIDNTMPPSGSKRTVKQAIKRPTILAAVKYAPTTVKNIKPVVPKKIVKIKKSNSASLRLLTAIGGGDINSVQKALSDGADPNAITSKGHSALTTAVQKGSFEIVQQLVAKGAVINQTTPAGETALMKAAWKGHVAISRWLLNRGAYVNLKNREKQTALFYAAIRGHNNIVDMLFEYGATWDLADQDSRTPLMAAAWNGRANVVHQLLSAGADPNRRDRDGWTPLMFAAFGGHAEVGKHLLSTGVNLSLKNNRNQTSADLANQQGHSDLIAMISGHMIK